MRTKTIRIVAEGRPGVDEFGVYPAASLLVKRWVSRGVSKGTIDSGEDCVVCSAAIIASAISCARERRSKMVSTHDVKAGWKTLLAYDLCLRPWECLGRSVTGRLDYVRDRLPVFDQVIGQLR
jgi:hypothetical protein